MAAQLVTGCLWFFSVLNEEITVAIILRQCGCVVSNFLPFAGLNDRLSFSLFSCAILTVVEEKLVDSTS